MKTKFWTIILTAATLSACGGSGNGKADDAYADSVTREDVEVVGLVDDYERTSTDQDIPSVSEVDFSRIQPDVDPSKIGGGDTKNQGKEAARPKGQVISLSQVAFAQKVADYKSAPSQYLGSTPALIDFWAPWCGPCQALAPAIDRIAEHVGITVYKVNVDDCPDICEAYGIEFIPTIFFAYDGKIQRFDGEPSEENLGVIALKLMGGR